MKKLLRGKNDETQLTFRYPVAVSSSFGLLHGFGFAAFLVIRPALKWLLLAQDHAVHWTWITTPASYGIGGIASYWLIDRISGFW